MNDQERAEALEATLQGIAFVKEAYQQTYKELVLAQAEVAQLKAELEQEHRENVAAQADVGSLRVLLLAAEENLRRVTEGVRVHLLALDQHSAAEIDPAVAVSARNLAALSEAPATERDRLARGELVIPTSFPPDIPAHPAEAPAQEEDR